MAAQDAVRHQPVELVVAICSGDQGHLDVVERVGHDLEQLRLTSIPQLLLQLVGECGPQFLPRRLGHVPLSCEAHLRHHVLHRQAFDIAEFGLSLQLFCPLGCSSFGVFCQSQLTPAFLDACSSCCWVLGEPRHGRVQSLSRFCTCGFCSLRCSFFCLLCSIFVQLFVLGGVSFRLQAPHEGGSCLLHSLQLACRFRGILGHCLG